MERLEAEGWKDEENGGEMERWRGENGGGYGRLITEGNSRMEDRGMGKDGTIKDGETGEMEDEDMRGR